MENSYKFYQNRDCQFFPCHTDIDEDSFNCLFCYCPVYFVQCPGDFRRLEDGRKDCMGCTLNHEPRFWDMVQSMMKNPKADSFPKRVHKSDMFINTEQPVKMNRDNLLVSYKSFDEPLGEVRVVPEDTSESS